MRKEKIKSGNMTGRRNKKMEGKKGRRDKIVENVFIVGLLKYPAPTAQDMKRRLRCDDYGP